MESSSLRVEIFIQARMGSERLPGKVLLDIMGKPVLWHLIERLKKMQNRVPVVILTSTSSKDDPIRAFCKEYGVSCFSGSEDDVLDRFYGAAKQRKPDAICRITSDCPLIDPAIVDKVVSYYINHRDVDYISNTRVEPYPHGMDVEIFSRSALDRAYSMCQNPAEKEHVTFGMYRHPELFSIGYINTFKDEERNLRLTLDTVADYVLISTLLETLYPKDPLFSLATIATFLKENPYILSINSQVKQKQPS